MSAAALALHDSPCTPGSPCSPPSVRDQTLPLTQIFDVTRLFDMFPSLFFPTTPPPRPLPQASWSSLAAVRHVSP